VFGFSTRPLAVYDSAGTNCSKPESYLTRLFNGSHCNARAEGVGSGETCSGLRVRGCDRSVREEEALDAEAVLHARIPRRREAVRRALLWRIRVRWADEVVQRTLRARGVSQLPLVRAPQARPAALLPVPVELEEEACAAQAPRA